MTRCDGDLAAEMTAGTEGGDEDAADEAAGAADMFDDTSTLFRAAEGAPWRRVADELSAAAGRRRSLAAVAAAAA